jgi:hypothetical protein
MEGTSEMMTLTDPCVYCGESTTLGATRPDGSLILKFINRVPYDLDGFACGECAGFECDECGEQIYIDCETRVEFVDESGHFHYGNYHTECYNETKHGKATYGQNIEEK